jgi:Putative prokaryotic signal transducing protein
VAEPVVLDVVPSEAEAELVVSLLRGAGLECAHRMSNQAAGAFGAAGGAGPYEVLVHAEDLDAAREVLRATPEPE